MEITGDVGHNKGGKTGYIQIVYLMKASGRVVSFSHKCNKVVSKKCLFIMQPKYIHNT